MFLSIVGVFCETSVKSPQLNTLTKYSSLARPRSTRLISPPRILRQAFFDVRRDAQRVREVVGRSGRQHGYGQIEVPPFEQVDHVVDRAVPAGDEDMVVAAVDVVQQVGLLGFGERQTVGHDRVPSSLVDVDDVVEPVGDYRLARFRIVRETDFLHLFLLFACGNANFLPDYRAIVRPSSGVTYVWKRPCSSE